MIINFFEINQDIDSFLLMTHIILNNLIKNNEFDPKFIFMQQKPLKK